MRCLYAPRESNKEYSLISCRYYILLEKYNNVITRTDCPTILPVLSDTVQYKIQHKVKGHAAKNNNNKHQSLSRDTTMKNSRYTINIILRVMKYLTVLKCLNTCNAHFSFSCILNFNLDKWITTAYFAPLFSKLVPPD